MTGPNAKACVRPIHGHPASTKVLAWQWQENNCKSQQQIHICMILKSFGCSFTFGSDLSDAGEFLHEYSRFSWPSLLAQHHDMKYQCHAFPGVGNLAIAESILKQLNIDQSNNLYVVNWTYIDRFDYTKSFNTWQTIRPGNESEHDKYYYKNLHCQFKDQLVNLITIKTVIDCIIAGGHDMIMTYMDDLLFEKNYHSSPATELLQNYIEPFMTRFENKNFLEWCRQNNLAISDTGQHPLEHAHRSAFELINSYNLV